MVCPVVMYGCESWTIKSWALKNWCFWTVVLEKTLESPLDCKEIQPVYLKGDRSWVFTGRTDVKAETPILWLPNAKNWLIWKDPDAGKDWKEENGMTEDETGWMASPTQCRWVWVNSGSSWWTGKPGVPQSIGLQRVRHDWANELNWTEGKYWFSGRQSGPGENNHSRNNNEKIRILTLQLQSPCYLITPIATLETHWRQGRTFV